MSMASVYILSLFILCHLYVYNFANDSRLDYYWYMLNIPKTEQNILKTEPTPTLDCQTTW